MAEVTIDTREAERSIKILRGIPRRMNLYILDALQVSAKGVAARTRGLLKSKGRSNPGQSPARQTGALAKSIRFRRVRSRASGPQLAYIVFHSRDTFYGRFLELGTKDRTTRRSGANRGRIEQRPFLSRANEELRSKNLALLRAAIERTLKEASTG